MVEATKRTDYWSVLDDHDCQTVLGIAHKQYFFSEPADDIDHFRF